MPRAPEDCLEWGLRGHWGIFLAEDLGIAQEIVVSTPHKTMTGLHV